MTQPLIPECVPSLWLSYKQSVADMKKLRDLRDQYAAKIDLLESDYKAARKLLPEYALAKSAAKERKKARREWETEQTPDVAFAVCVNTDSAKEAKEILKMASEKLKEYESLEDGRQELEKCETDFTAAKRAAQAFAEQLADAE